MILAQDLRDAVLQAAIQGKLTQQLKSDSSVDELLEQIRTQKELLIKEKKIKKEKPLKPISEDEIPFDIPANWKWVRLNTICKSIVDGDHQAPPQTTKGIPFLVISNISKGNLDFSDTRYVSQEYFDSLSNERKAHKYDILFTVTGSYGIPVIVDCERAFCFQRHIALLKSLSTT